jgi:hypothetical protein
MMKHHFRPPAPTEHGDWLPLTVRACPHSALHGESRTDPFTTVMLYVERYDLPIRRRMVVCDPLCYHEMHHN